MLLTAHAERPLLPVAWALLAGAWLGADLPPAAAAVWLVLAAVALAGAWLRGASPLCSASLLAAALALGAAARAVEDTSYERTPLRRFLVEAAPEAPVRLEGTLADDSQRMGERAVLLVDVESLSLLGQARPLSGRARIAVSDPLQALELAQGERVSLWASIRPPRGHASPGAFDVEANARRRGIHAFGYCKGRALVVLRPPRSARVFAALARARRSARRILVSLLPPGEESGLVRAMVLGDRTGVSEQTSEAFRIAGTYHVLALSGAQVALVAGLLLTGLRSLRASPSVAGFVAGAGVWLYAWFVGGDAPVTRAALMVSCFTLGKALDLEADLANLLSLAALCLIVNAPGLVGDPSFQLSFGATLGILLFGPQLVGLLPKLPFAAHWVIGASLAAQLSLQPLLAAHFHRLAPAAILLNLAAGPLASAVLLSGFGLLAVHALSPALAASLSLVSFGFAHALLRSSDLAAAFPWLDVRVATPGVPVVLGYCVGLAWLAKGRRVAGLVSLAGATLLIGCGPAPGADGRLWLGVLDVGQGDALVLRSPGGRFLVVDAGGAAEGFDAGEAVVAPYLWSLGARRIDRLSLTHGDRDHVGGAPFLAQTFGIGRIWQGAMGDARIDRALRAIPAPRATLRSGDRLAWDDVEVECLGPPSGGGRASNDSSLVLRLRYRGVSLLLTGDIESAGERNLRLLPTDVLKVAHHGSRTSTTDDFVRRVHPRLAVVSVGFRSPFGHPSGEVLERLRRAGAALFRTDLDGTVSVATDGTRIWLESFRSERREAR